MALAEIYGLIACALIACNVFVFTLTIRVIADAEMVNYINDLEQQMENIERVYYKIILYRDNLKRNNHVARYKCEQSLAKLRQKYLDIQEEYQYLRHNITV